MKSLQISSTLTCPSSVLWLYVIFHMKTTKIKTLHSNVFSKLSAILHTVLPTSAPPTPNLLHPLQICSIHSKFAPPAHFQTSGSCFYIIIHTKQKHIRVFFLQTQINILFRYSPHLLILHIHSTLLAHSPHPLHPLIHSIRQRRKNALETVSISASTSTVPVFKFKFLHYAPHQKRQLCVYYGVFQMKINLTLRNITLRNMNGRLYCCYQKSPYQLCPHILVFMFKNYIPHRQTDRRTQSHTHTHTQYVYD